MTASPWQKGLSWAFVAIALMCVGLAVWFIAQPNPSGDYISGMASLFLALMAAGGAVLGGMCAIAARLFHRRSGRWMAAGVIVIIAALAVLYFGVV